MGSNGRTSKRLGYQIAEKSQGVVNRVKSKEDSEILRTQWAWFIGIHSL